MSLSRLVLAATLILVVSVSAHAAEMDPLTPGDTESYLSINLKSLRESKLFKEQLQGPLKEMLSDVPEIKNVLGDLDFDPMKDLDRVQFATPNAGDADRGLVIMHGTFDTAKFTKRAEEAARENDDALKIHKVALGGGLTHTVWEVIIPGQDTSLYVALVSNKVMVASPGKDYVVDALKHHRAKKKASLKNKEFQALVEKLDARQTMSLAVLGKSVSEAVGGSLPKSMADSIAKIDAIGGGVTVGNEVKLELVVAGKDARAAEAVREGLDRGVKLALVGLALLAENRKELGLLLEVVKTIKVSGKGAVVSVSGKLTADVLEDFLKKDE